MTGKGRQTPRKPATKFARLRKKWKRTVSYRRSPRRNETPPAHGLGLSGRGRAVPRKGSVVHREAFVKLPSERGSGIRRITGELPNVQIPRLFHCPIISPSRPLGYPCSVPLPCGGDQLCHLAAARLLHSLATNPGKGHGLRCRRPGQRFSIAACTGTLRCLIDCGAFYANAEEAVPCRRGSRLCVSSPGHQGSFRHPLAPRPHWQAALAGVPRLPWPHLPDRRLTGTGRSHA